MMNRIFVRAVLPLSIFAMALAGCQRGPADLSTAPLAGTRIGGPFTLTDQDGKRVSDKDFAGKFRIIYFGYTFCPDACPTDMQFYMAGFRQFEREHPADAAKVQPLFISVDPARDTPAKLKVFTAAFHPRLMGLTGSAAEIAAVTKEYAAVYQLLPPGPNGQYLVDHSKTAILFGPKGEPIVILPDERAKDISVADTLATWVR